MWKNLNTSIRNPSPDSNESVVVGVILYEDENGITLQFSREDATVKPGGKVRTNAKETLKLNGFHVEQFMDLFDLLEDWVESESKSTFIEPIPDITGEYEREEVDHSLRGMTTKTTYSFDTLRFSVGEHAVSFSFDSEDGRKRVEVPSAEHIDRGIPQDFRNVILLGRVFYDFLTKRYSGDIEHFDIKQPVSIETGEIERIERIFDRFDLVARQLEERSRGRPPLMMADEYDVQYLLHALLKIHFEDIRDETYLKRHASISPRIDFLIEDEKIGIETKRASSGRPLKKIRTELAEDKEQYRSDSLCETLLCFIYDPERVLTNPAEVEKDLSETTDNLTTRVTVTQ